MDVHAKKMMGAKAIVISNGFIYYYSLPKFRIVKLLKFIIPSPKANGGSIRSPQAIPLAMSADPSLFIHLKVNITIGKSPPIAKLKKYTVPCAFPYFWKILETTYVNGILANPNKKNSRLVAARASPSIN